MTASFHLDRRQFLGGTAATAATAAIGPVATANNEKKKLVIVDCHAHIYGTPTEEKRYPTIAKPYRPPKGTGTIAVSYTHLTLPTSDLV